LKLKKRRTRSEIAAEARKEEEDKTLAAEAKELKKKVLQLEAENKKLKHDDASKPQPMETESLQHHQHKK
jgi:hypothetical protein